GPQISTDLQPRLLATEQVLSMSHFSPAMLKHQKTTECLMFPLSRFSSVCMADASGVEMDAATLRAAAVVRSSRRVSGMTAPFEFVCGSFHFEQHLVRRLAVRRIVQL